MKKIIWYICVFIATLSLIISVFLRHWGMLFIAVGMCIILHHTNKYIDIPDFYVKRGVTNSYFDKERKRSEQNEKNH